MTISYRTKGRPIDQIHIMMLQGLIGKGVLTSHLIVSNSENDNRLHVGNLNLVSASGNFGFPSNSIGTIG